jgi:hypothetical protein
MAERFADHEETSSKNRRPVQCNEKQLEVGAILANSETL